MKISALAGIVGQHVPWQRMIAVSHAQKAAEGHHGVGNFPRDFVDHHSIDGAKLLPLPIVDRGALNLIRG
jgi:hypothetical protein